MNHSISIIIIIFLAGLLGGATNYFRIEQEKSGHPLWKNLLMGICAALLIPLFLNMISSNLISESSSDSSKLFIIFGFCLVASLYSNEFIQSISNRILNEVKKTEEKVKRLKNDVEPLIYKETEPTEIGNARIRSIDFDSDTKKIVEVLGGGKYVWRSARGIARETGMKREVVIESLRKLVEKRLAIKTREKGRWGLTSDGRAVYIEISADKK